MEGAAKSLSGYDGAADTMIPGQEVGGSRGDRTDSHRRSEFDIHLYITHRNITHLINRLSHINQLILVLSKLKRAAIVLCE